MDQMTSPDDFHLFSLRNVLLLGLVGAAALLPVFLRRRNKDSEGNGRGQVYLAEEDEQDAREQGLDESWRRNQLLFQDDEDQNDDDADELPRRNLDTRGIADVGEESFPSWRDRQNEYDEEEAEEQDDREVGRGGVFSDRQGDSMAKNAKIGFKGWIAGNRSR